MGIIDLTGKRFGRLTVIYKTLLDRFHRGWSAEKIIETPIREVAKCAN